MKQSFYIAAAALVLALALPISASANSFAKLTPDADDLAAAEPVCEPPTVPHNVAVGLRDVTAYKDWWERMDLEIRLEQKRCDCEPVGITWEQVAEKADPWLDLGKITPTWTVPERMRLARDRRTEMDNAISELKSEIRAMCGAN